MTNADRHTPAGTAIKLTAYQAGHYIKIDLIDYGPGIPSHLQADIFKRFRRADNGS